MQCNIRYRVILYILQSCSKFCAIYIKINQESVRCENDSFEVFVVEGKMKFFLATINYARNLAVGADLFSLRSREANRS